MGHPFLSVESCDRFCIYEVEQPPWMLRCLRVGVAAKSARPCGTHIEERVTLKSTIALLVLCSPAAIRGPQGGGCRLALKHHSRDIRLANKAALVRGCTRIC